MAELPEGYRDISPDEQAKARKFFEYGKNRAETGSYDYAIEMYLSGLAIDPDALDAHQALREIGMVRRAGGGKDLGMMEKMKLKRPTKEDRQNMLNAEKVLAYDPGNMDVMLSLCQNAVRGGFYDTAMWMAGILMRANTESPKPDFHKYVALKDIFKDLKRWKEAIDACSLAAKMRPDDMDLQTELKNLSAYETMSKGAYDSAASFRDSMKDKDKQVRMIEEQRDVVSEDVSTRKLRDAEAEWKADPTESGKIIKYVEALEQTEDMESENRAIEILEEAYKGTKQFRFRQRSGRIKMAQLSRMERSLRAALKETPNDEHLKKDYAALRREQLEFELAEYSLAAETYPTDLALKFQIATRMSELGRHDEAIPLYQQARSDPKLKNKATLALGKAFLNAQFVDEAVETLQGLIEEYEIKGDDLSKEMYYSQGRALEEKGQIDQSLKRYSQVFQWESTYRDVGPRIRALRAKKQGGT